MNQELALLIATYSGAYIALANVSKLWESYMCVDSKTALDALEVSVICSNSVEFIDWAVSITHTALLSVIVGRNINLVLHCVDKYANMIKHINDKHDVIKSVILEVNEGKKQQTYNENLDQEILDYLQHLYKLGFSVKSKFMASKAAIQRGLIKVFDSFKCSLSCAELAIEYGRLDIAKYLLNKYKFFISSKTAVKLCCRYSRWDILKELVVRDKMFISGNIVTVAMLNNDSRIRNLIVDTALSVGFWPQLHKWMGCDPWLSYAISDNIDAMIWLEEFKKINPTRYVPKRDESIIYSYVKLHGYGKCFEWLIERDPLPQKTSLLQLGFDTPNEQELITWAFANHYKGDLTMQYDELLNHAIITDRPKYLQFVSVEFLHLRYESNLFVRITDSKAIRLLKWLYLEHKSVDFRISQWEYESCLWLLGEKSLEKSPEKL